MPKTKTLVVPVSEKQERVKLAKGKVKAVKQDDRIEAKLDLILNHLGIKL